MKKELVCLLTFIVTGFCFSMEKNEPAQNKHTKNHNTQSQKNLKKKAHRGKKNKEMGLVFTEDRRSKDLVDLVEPRFKGAAIFPLSLLFVKSTSNYGQI
jgi:hypothetical protein